MMKISKILPYSTLLSIIFLSLISCSVVENAEQNTDNSSHWLASWGTSPYGFQSFGNAAPPAAFENQTIRQIVRLSVGGDQVRIRFSNEIGDTPLTIGAATVALANADFSIKGSTIQTLTFGGEASITIPAGAPALSDPVNLSVEDLELLAISMYLPEESPVSTTHNGRISFVSSAGDFTQALELDNSEASTNMVFLTGVYVNSTEDINVLVTLGDSITDGTASTPYTFNNWPALFAERLSTMNNQKKLAIINQGISGNQVLADGAGRSALTRFDRDVLATPGITHIILMEGINDIGRGGISFGGGPVPEMMTAKQIIAGYQQLISRAHAMSPPIKIFGATLTPFEGTFPGYYSPEKDLIRHEVNDWIRNSGMFDAVVDFDLAVQDPDNTNVMKEEYNSGDNLHPGDLGYKRMADSIDVSLFND